MMTSGMLGVGGLFDGAGDDFADDRAHGAADEGVLHGAHDYRASVEFALRVDDRVVQAGVVASLFEARRVGLQVDKFQRVGGDQVAVEGFVTGYRRTAGQAGTGVDAEMLVAFRADVEIVLQILLPDDLAAAVTLHPEAFGAHLLFARSVEFTGLAFEPGHGCIQ